jgi:DNA mismatch repair protein MutL
MTRNLNSSVVVLDEHTANRIAAGEVIERPSSVVKELVENSIDAGATRILVELEDGGKKLIRVTDNGLGMGREDAVLSLQRHATSKIRSADDLFDIRTLGFRGEALPSIASVSILELVTTPAGDSSGVRLRAEAGTITDLEQVGAPQGTSIAVRELFFNTPARLKFLKTAQTELHHISDLVGRFALAYPGVTFRLVQGGRELFSAPASGNLLNALLAVFGRDIARELMPISFETPALKVSGYASKPSLTRANRAQQIFFVNGRSIRSRTMIHAADEAFRGLLTPARYPVVVVFVGIDPALVDVNVHPTKAEVKFSREGDIHSAVHRAIKDALSGSGSMPAFGGDGRSSASAAAPRPRQEQLIRTQDVDTTAFREALRARTQPEPDSGDPFSWKSGTQTTVEPAEEPVQAAEEPSTFEAVSLEGLRIIGQLKNTYILAETDDGLLLIDQHAAHERILFGRMILAKEKETLEVQRLVVPATISLGRRESILVNQKLSDFKRAGFELEWFGKDSFVVRAVPACLADRDYLQALRDMVDELVETTVARRLIARQEQVLTTASCKMAVKAGDALTHEEMSRLIEDLLNSQDPFMCPHGRPVIVTLSTAEMARRFRR